MVWRVVIVRFEGAPAAIHDLLGVTVRREHGIEDVLDRAIVDDHRQPLVQENAIGDEGGKAQCVPDRELGIGQHREGQVQPVDQFPLVVAGL
jgi:hypothetical protein